MPVALAINNTRASIPNIMITNSGSQRFDVYAGPFTKNDHDFTSYREKNLALFKEARRVRSTVTTIFLPLKG